MKTLSRALVTTALAGGLALSLAGPAAAAHCVDSDASTSGFSYFGQEVAAGDREAQATKGASTCRETTGSPSDRAPGQQ